MRGTPTSVNGRPPPADRIPVLQLDPVIASAREAKQLAGVGGQEAPPLELTQQVYEYKLADQRKLRERTSVVPPAYEGSPITEGGF